MMAFLLFLLSLFVLQVQAATIEQTTTGWCSPAVGKADNVTIICQGVDPKALEVLNESLRLMNLHLDEKIKEANTWARKYHELEERLATEGQDSPLAQQAQALIKEGKLEEAGALLERLINAEEKVVERAAAHQFNLAEVYALQFQPHKALPHYAKAYQYRPDNSNYALRYAVTLHEQHDFVTAEAIYTEHLATLRTRATADSDRFLPSIAVVLEYLGILYRDTQRLSECEHAFKEALQIWRQLGIWPLAMTKFSSHYRYMYTEEAANTLQHLGILYRDTQRLSECEHAFKEAFNVLSSIGRNHTAHYNRQPGERPAPMDYAAFCLR